VPRLDEMALGGFGRKSSELSQAVWASSSAAAPKLGSNRCSPRGVIERGELKGSVPQGLRQALVAVEVEINGGHLFPVATRRNK
jgi:hypothetical protein